MLKAISKVDPRKKMEVSGFRMDSNNLKTVQLIRSETYLTELMEDVCKYLTKLYLRILFFNQYTMLLFFHNKGKSMDDYAKARHKETRELVVIKMMVDGGMNPMMSEVDFVYDGDLNKSLEHFVSPLLFLTIRNQSYR